MISHYCYQNVGVARETHASSVPTCHFAAGGLYFSRCLVPLSRSLCVAQRRLPYQRTSASNLCIMKPSGILPLLILLLVIHFGLSRGQGTVGGTQVGAGVSVTVAAGAGAGVSVQGTTLQQLCK